MLVGSLFDCRQQMIIEVQESRVWRPVNDTQFGLSGLTMNSGGLIMVKSAGNSGVQAESISDIHYCTLIK